MNSTPVIQLLGIQFYFSADEAQSLISELESLIQEGRILTSVLEGLRRDINIQLSQPYGGGFASGS
jgi:hypothetical protein